ncbi:MAG: membrane protein insertase YidC, partial [Cyanobacteria bacterium J06576_12]
SGMFLFFPLPAGVLMYMVIANVFQTVQSFILSREPLPENLQKLVDAQAKSAGNGSSDNRKTLAFEPGAAKRAAKAEASKGKATAKKKSAKKKASK